MRHPGRYTALSTLLWFVCIRAREILRGSPSVERLRTLADEGELHPRLRYKIRLPEKYKNRAETILASVKNVTQTLLSRGIPTSPAERVFRHAGKHEPTHVAAGLDTWYSSKLVFISSGGADVARRLPAGPLPSPSMQAHSAVDAIEILLNETSGAHDHLDGVEGAHLTRLYYTPDDTYYSSYQAMDMGATNVATAWDTTAGSSEIIVQVIDDGVYGEPGTKGGHPDLEKNIWQNGAESGTSCGDGVDDDDNGYIDDCYGYNFADDSNWLQGSGSHGTHVAGTIAAETDNGIGVAGVAGGKGGSGGVSMMISTAFGRATPGGFAEALVYGADNGAHVSCNSWGYVSEGYYEQAVLDAIDYAVANGVIVVFAAGNDNNDGQWYPAYHDTAIAVASTSSVDNSRSVFSNYGNWIDIAAPGTNIVSTYTFVDYSYSYSYSYSYYLDYTYGMLSGTSMACPHVAGIIALALSHVGDSVSQEHILSCMHLTAQNIDAVNIGYEGKLGSGLIDAAAMLECCSAPAPTSSPSSTPAPTSSPSSTPTSSPSSTPAPTYSQNKFQGIGWCVGGVDDYIGDMDTASECWDACDSKYTDNLVAIDWWPESGNTCYCQDACVCMAQVGNDGVILIAKEGLVIPEECGSYTDDLTTDENSCENRCGSGSIDFTCWCDLSCLDYGDCCSDYDEFCGDYSYSHSHSHSYSYSYVEPSFSPSPHPTSRSSLVSRIIRKHYNSTISKAQDQLDHWKSIDPFPEDWKFYSTSYSYVDMFA